VRILAASATLTVGKAAPNADPIIPVNIGEQLGIFKKHGLDLKIVDFTGGSRMTQAMAAGGALDFAARQCSVVLSRNLGQQIFVENRTGAGGNIAVEAVARAPADGYTLLQLNVANAINTALYEKLNFNLLNDIVPVASFMRVPNVMEVTLSLPVKTVPEFIAYARANPGRISFASSGVGSSIHMSGELFKAMAKIDMLHVPYRGIAAGGLSDLITGVVQVAFDNLPSSIELIRSGKVRALAVTTTARSELLPDVPTVGDFLPGYEASAWFGVGAPSGTPAEIVQKLNKELNAAFVDPRTKARIAEVGGTPLPGSPGDFGRFIAKEVEKWDKVVEFSGVKIKAE